MNRSSPHNCYIIFTLSVVTLFITACDDRFDLQKLQAAIYSADYQSPSAQQEPRIPYFQTALAERQHALTLLENKEPIIIQGPNNYQSLLEQAIPEFQSELDKVLEHHERKTNSVCDGSCQQIGKPHLCSCKIIQR